MFRARKIPCSRQQTSRLTHCSPYMHLSQGYSIFLAKNGYGYHCSPPPKWLPLFPGIFIYVFCYKFCRHRKAVVVPTESRVLVQQWPFSWWDIVGKITYKYCIFIIYINIYNTRIKFNSGKPLFKMSGKIHFLKNNNFRMLYFGIW